MGLGNQQLEREKAISFGGMFLKTTSSTLPFYTCERLRIDMVPCGSHTHRLENRTRIQIRHIRIRFFSVPVTFRHLYMPRLGILSPFCVAWRQEVGSI
ncbi:hypothetical protein OPV22_023463 [Ensete ventricosum]|uniref:Uncharacterized protein n=1 Tax=Ensete ventricosum TaxID=4639 RepID=A0AAV8PCT5_ENSVE|nr:hypothetical protein OPV22_023463 [Ensete ventricosum]